MNARRIAARLYSSSLHAFPSEHRARYEAEMVDAFVRAFDARRECGVRSATRFVIAACVDAVRAGTGERRRCSKGRRRLWPGALTHDLAHAVRALARARAFTFVCVLSLGVGMGAVFALLGLVRVLVGPNRSDMTNWDTMDTGDVASHEYGHMIGHPDEYASTTCPRRSPVSTGTVMDDNTEVVERLVRPFCERLGETTSTL